MFDSRYFPDDATNPGGKPWNNESPNAPFDFYNAKDTWYATWEAEDAAMQVDYIKVWAL